MVYPGQDEHTSLGTRVYCTYNHTQWAIYKPNQPTAYLWTVEVWTPGYSEETQQAQNEH